MVYYQKMNHFTQVFTYHTVKKSPLNLTTRDTGIWLTTSYINQSFN